MIINLISLGCLILHYTSSLSTSCAMTALFVPLHGFVEVIVATVIINILGFSEVETAIAYFLSLVMHVMLMSLAT